VNALLVVGAIMVAGIEQNKPQITLKDVTPIARLFTEYNVIAVRKESEFKTLEDLLKAFKDKPTSITWGGGSKGSVDHIGIAELAGKMDVPVNKVNYVAFGGGGEAVMPNWANTSRAASSASSPSARRSALPVSMRRPSKRKATT